jgi:hypothetical protein
MADTSVIPYSALAIVSNLVSGLGGTVPKYLGWGTGAGVAARGNTSLFTESMSTSNDGSGHNTRVTATVSRVTTSQANDTVRFVGTLTADAAKTITNIGFFDTNGQAADLVTAPSGGNLFLKTSFDTGYALNAGDSIQFTQDYILG